MNLQNWQLERQLTVLGVSGGIDSMVLLHVFVQNQWPCVVAHVNYQLRGEDSLGDMNLVEETCKKLGVECFVKQVDTKKIATELGISIQMAARDIRYHFFEEILVNVGAQKIATAHHQDDELENFFIYLMRNQMHNAWVGIPEERGNIIRPLLRIPRKIIEDFAAENAIQWRDDRSNNEIKYLRNKIRHLIVPQIKEMYPNVALDYQELTRKARENERESTREFELRWTQFVDFKESGGEIPQEFIINLNNKNGIFRKLIHLGFNESQVNQVLNPMQMIGSQWINGKWRMRKLRSGIGIEPNCDVETKTSEIRVEGLGNFEFGNFQIRIAKISRSEVDFTLKNSYYFHNHVLKNLKLRSWIQGDKMTILGMKGRKKVSDVFTNLKVEMTQKNEYPILVCDTEIVAIVGLKRSNLYLIEDENEVIAISWKLNK